MLDIDERDLLLPRHPRGKGRWFGIASFAISAMSSGAVGVCVGLFLLFDQMGKRGTTGVILSFLFGWLVTAVGGCLGLVLGMLGLRYSAREQAPGWGWAFCGTVMSLFLLTLACGVGFVYLRLARVF